MVGIHKRRKTSLQLTYFSLIDKACCIIMILYSVNAENPCNEAQFWVVDEENKSFCVECNSCPPGHGLSHKCGHRISPDMMVTCERCKPGLSFSNNDDVSSCLQCDSPCAEDQVVLQNCTIITDVKCKSECYSKNRYYESKIGCLPCSKCCGDGKDAVEDECKQKLGAASDTICSFNSTVNRCVLTTASPQHATSFKNKSSHPSFTLNTTTTQIFISSDDQNGSDHGIAVTAASILSVVLFLIILAVAALLCHCFSSRRWSCLRPKDTEAAEMGLGRRINAAKNAPMAACNTESKPLRSLLEHECTLQRICEVLDTPAPGCGHYKAVAQHYGFNHYQIESVLKPFHGGPSRALIESLAATHTELNVEEFAVVIETKTKRKDLVKLLREYDLTEEERL